MTRGDRLLDVLPIFVVAPPFPNKLTEDNKDGIISSVPRVMDKQKMVLTMRESSSNVGCANIRRHVQRRCGLARQPSSLSSNPEGVVVIHDDEMHCMRESMGVQVACCSSKKFFKVYP